MKRFGLLFTLLVFGVSAGYERAPSQEFSAAAETAVSEKRSWKFAVDTPVTGLRGVVTSKDPLATAAGMRILAQGGNAIDAIVATAAALAVVEPGSSGAGGIGAMILYPASTGEAVALEFLGAAPSLVQMDQLDEETSSAGIRAACVPGTVAGWAEAVEKYGKLSLAQVLQPAIEYAEEGFAVSTRLSNSIRGTETLSPGEDPFFRRGILRRSPTTERIFLPGGKVPEPGDILVQKDLAQTLRRIAAQGPDVFYRGEIAEAFVKFSEEHGGFFTREDFARYQPRWAKPVSTTYRGYEVHAVPPPTSGPTALQTLNILEGYDLKALGRHSAGFTHLFSEAAKLASADEIAHIADPAFVSVPVSMLISKEYADHQRERILEEQAAIRVPVEAISETGGNTTALLAADREGNVVTLIQTHLKGFGSGVVFGDTGVLFNQALRHMRSDGPNRFEAGKHVRNATVPVLVTLRGKPVLALGAAGAETIWQTQLQVLMNVIDYGMNVQEAISAPRMAIAYGYNAVGGDMGHVDGFTYGEIFVERDYLEGGVAADLERRGHTVIEVGTIGTVQGIQIDGDRGILMGGADPRAGGQASTW